MKLIEPNDPKSGWEKYEHAEYALYKKYQMVIHNDTPQKCSYEGFQRFLVKSPLKVSRCISPKTLRISFLFSFLEQASSGSSKEPPSAGFRVLPSAVLAGRQAHSGRSHRHPSQVCQCRLFLLRSGL